MKLDKLETRPHSFLFQIDVLIQADTNGAALEHLLHVLNGGNFADFRIGSGIQLGQTIEAAIAGEKKSATKDRTGASQASAAKTQAAAPKPDELEMRIRQYIENNKLIRLHVNKGRGVKLSIPCRIIGFDSARQILTVYHVDEKQVHSLKLFEIDDFVE